MAVRKRINAELKALKGIEHRFTCHPNGSERYQFKKAIFTNTKGGLLKVSNLTFIVLLILDFSLIIAPIDAWMLLRYRPEKAHRHLQTMKSVYAISVILCIIIMAVVMITHQDVASTSKYMLEYFTTITVVFLTVWLWIKLIESLKNKNSP